MHYVGLNPGGDATTSSRVTRQRFGVSIFSKNMPLSKADHIQINLSTKTIFVFIIQMENSKIK